MNIEKHLIFVKGEDQTEKIKSCRYDNSKWQVTFYNNKSYSYNYNNIVLLKNPISLNPAITVVYENDQPISGIIQIFDFGEFIRLCFKTGYTKVHKKSNIIIEETCLNNKNANNCFEYLKQLSDKVSVSNEEDISFLSKQYNRIINISPRSILAAYLHPTQLKKTYNNIPPIFPFGFNISQKSATEKALTEQISVIEGPPGTGKTQTILNIIANAIMKEKTVAVVSNNNSATKNVLEKLQKYGVDFIAAFIGNNENKEIFFNGQSAVYPDMSTWLLDFSTSQSISEYLFSSVQKLDEMLEIRNRVSILKKQLSDLSVENEYFRTYYNETNESILQYRSFYKHSSDTVMTLWLEYQQFVENNDKIPFIFKLRNLIFYGIFSFKFYNNLKENIIALYQKLYYELKSKELNNEISSLTKKLDNFNFDNEIKKYCENSMKLFKDKLAKRFIGKGSRAIFSNEDLWKNFESFIGEYPVILSTTHSLRNCASENYLFDYVIIDEASQVDLVTGALALSCAKNAVIVGDLKQLPNVVSSDIKKVTEQTFERYSLNTAYRYADNSILSSFTKLYKDVPKTLLKEHYRCHPKIIGFCNQKFYNNELIILTEENEQDKPLAVYKTSKGNHARGHFNQRQIDVIFEEIIPEQKIDDDKLSVGIVTPYRLQANELKKVIGTRNIEADTVHKYQGRERDVIILTTVVNEINEFVDNPNLVNVAVSRAIDKLIVVVSDNDNNDNSNIGDLVKYIKYNNFETVNSNIYSVFDLLYQSYSDKLLSVLRNSKKVSDFQSENLMNTVIENVLNQPEFQNLDKVMHQPLKMLIKDPTKLNDDECKFAMNILTHTDFLIFNKLNKMPVLVVEVDGYAFHANNPKQLENDKKKDTILQKYDIPILRIKTNESGEELRLRNKLVEISSK